MQRQAHGRHREDGRARATGYGRGGRERSAREDDGCGRASGKHGARDHRGDTEGQEVTETLLAEEKGQRGSGGREDESRGHGPPEGGSGTAAAGNAGVPTNPDVAAGQQGAGGHQKSGAAVKKTESATGFRTGSGRGAQRRKRERRRGQRLREHREGRQSSGCDAPVEGRRTAGVCQHPGEAKRVKAPHPSYGGRGQRPKRWQRDPGGLCGERRYGSAGVHTRWVKRQHQGAGAGLTSMGGGMPATWRPKMVWRRCRRAQVWPALCGRSRYWPRGSHTGSNVAHGMPHEARPHCGARAGGLA